MAKKRQSKEKVKFEKFLPGESTWRPRKNKTFQDRQPVGRRERVNDWAERIEFMHDKKPSVSRHWTRAA
jgi:hypothetical protein